MKLLKKNTPLISLLGLILLTQTGFSQVEIILQKQSFEVGSRTFYISKVIDSRKQKDNIGYTKNNLDEKVAIRLVSGTTTAIQSFIDHSLSPKTGHAPVIMQVHYLKVKEEQSSVAEITTRGEIKLVFYEQDKAGLKQVYAIEHYEDEVFEEARQTDILNAQAKKVQRLLEHCLKSFAEERRIQKTTVKYVNPEVLRKPSDIETLTITEKKPLGKWHNLLMYERIWGHHTEGWRVSYVGFSDQNPDFIIPFTFSFGRSQTKEATNKNSEYQAVDDFTFDFGVQFYTKLFVGLYADLALQVPIGLEKLKDRQNKTSNNFLLGAKAYQGIMFIPNTSLGITFGAGIFQRVQTSKIYRTNWGGELKMGIKF